MMAKYLRFLVICCALATATLGPQGCRRPNLPPGGQPIWDQIQFLKVVDALQQTAIDANHALPQQLTDAQEVLVLKFTRGAALATKASANGWQAVVRSLWESLQKDLDAAVKERYKIQLAAVGAFVAVIPGGV
jgi:hypothetical protein